MKKILLLSLLGSIAFLHVSARHDCADNRIRHTKLAAKTSSASPLLDLYDVKYVKLDLALSHLNTSFSGSATTRAVVDAASGMGKYVFEISDNVVIDSARFNGSPATVSKVVTDLRQIILPSTLIQGTSFTVQIFYHGTGVNGSGFFTHALNHQSTSGYDITFTLSDRDLSKEWWPCKQSLNDKIDSADLWFTVPSAAKAGSNGLLQNVTTVGSNSRYEWKTRYPVVYYLIFAAVSNYFDHSTYMHFTGGSDSMLVQHYLYNSAPLSSYGTALDSTGYTVDYFSQLFGRYPFWKEKYGHCAAPLSGGMEHQTMSTLGGFTPTLIAHELGHQWWGDHVTYAGWADIWLSEGLATYCEQLYTEYFKGAAAAQSYRTPVFNRVMSAPDGSVYVDDTTNTSRIFEYRLTYDKGAAVSHMLRYIAPSDAAFFNGLRAYQQRYAFRSTITDSFKTEMEAAYGRKLDTFFNQWVYGQGYPTYNGTWNQKGSNVFVQLAQTTSFPSSVSAFAMPLVLQLQSTTGDTLVKVYMDNNLSTYSFNWGREMTGFIIDPKNEVVNKAGIVNQDPALGAATVNRIALSVAPNPSSEGWKIAGIPQGCSLKLLDAAGRVVYQRLNPPHSIDLGSSQLAAGVYTLYVQHNGSVSATYKLVHK